jgi:hypothetical protein
MPSKQSGLQYATVTEEEDGSLACSCHAFDQTGKDCVHIKAARLQIAYGPVTDPSLSLCLIIFRGLISEESVIPWRGWQADFSTTGICQIDVCILN